MAYHWKCSTDAENVAKPGSSIALYSPETHGLVKHFALLQDLEKYTSSKRSLQVWRMQPWFHPPVLLQGHEELARLLAELLSIGSPTGLKPGVADVVLKIETQISRGAKPPVAAIRHPRVRLQTKATDKIERIIVTKDIGSCGGQS